jgi:hypothetical protein
MRKIAAIDLPTTIFLASLPPQLRQSLGMSMAKAQVTLHGWRLTWTPSLRPGRTFFPMSML